MSDDAPVDLERRVSEQEALLEIGLELAATLDLRRVLSLALTKAEEFCRAETSSIWEVDEAARELFFRVVRGRAFDVAVDLRRGSPTFARWFGSELSADNRRQMWVPPGFAHGFVALEDDTHFLYKTTDVYAKDRERSIRWNDPALAIAWPLPPGVAAPRLAPKDAEAPPLAEAELP